MAHVELHGADTLRARLRAIAPDSEMMRRVGLEVIENQKREAPVKTGNLRRSIRLGSVGRTGLTTVANADYAAFVEFGTQPHEIVPVRARALRFAARGVATTLSGRPTAAARAQGGAYTFARRVMHPGTKSNPFMRRGVERAGVAHLFKSIIVERWNRAG